MIIRGLKCDNPNCDWVYEHELTIDELEQWIGKLCPSCKKSIIVTQKEYDLAILCEKVDRWVLKIMRFLHLKPKKGAKVDLEPIRWGEKPKFEKVKLTDEDLKEHGWYKK